MPPQSTTALKICSASRSMFLILRIACLYYSLFIIARTG
jgi:hypothetical protein